MHHTIRVRIAPMKTSKQAYATDVLARSSPQTHSNNNPHTRVYWETCACQPFIRSQGRPREHSVFLYSLALTAIPSVR